MGPAPAVMWDPAAKNVLPEKTSVWVTAVLPALSVMDAMVLSCVLAPVTVTVPLCTAMSLPVRGWMVLPAGAVAVWPAWTGVVLPALTVWAVAWLEASCTAVWVCALVVWA